VESADWTTASFGYDGDCLTTPSGVGDESATWRADGLDAGSFYHVFSTWIAGSNRATNTPLSVSGGAGQPTTVCVNQRIAPDEVTALGAEWESLGVFQTDTGSLVVAISNDGNGLVVADAIYIIEVTPAAEPADMIDDGETGFAQAGADWRNLTSPDYS
jgi:hypothetical protein